MKVLILVSGGRSNVKTTQRVGRAVRKWHNKDEAIIYDFLDDFFYLTRKHSEVRQGIYRKLGFSVSVEELNQPQLCLDR